MLNKKKRHKVVLGEKQQKGFTLIEVVLVLAIGGLIFLLAFLAFSQVQRNRRNTERRSSLSLVVAELQNRYTDTNNYPQNYTTAFNSGVAASGDNTLIANFVNDYLKGSEFKGPSGVVYTWLGSATAPSFTNLGPIFLNAGSEIMTYAVNSRCSGSSVLSDSTTIGSIVVLVALEGGVACRDVK